MYDEDRKLALAMYSDMFDSCRDEELLVQSLGSPTRQAVAIARNYNAKERKLQLYSEDRENTEAADTPAFLITISTIMDEALEGNKFSNPVDENQFSLFSDDNQPHVDFSQPLPTPVAAARTAAVAGTVAAEAPSAEASIPAVSAPAENSMSVDDFLSEILDETPVSAANEAPIAEAPAEEAAIQNEPVIEVADVVSTEVSEGLQDSQDPVDRFISDFSINEAVIPEQPVVPAKETVREAVPAEPAPVSEPAAEESYPSLYNEDDFYTEPQLKVDTILLILYIIAAVPLSLIGITVLLVLTAVVLAFAVACIVGGLFVFSAGLGGLTMIADIMVVLGGGIALFALGLLFLWTAVWLVFGGMVGLIRGVITLAKKWCYKEVEQ